MKTIATYFKRLRVIIIITSLTQSISIVGFAQDSEMSSLNLKITSTKNEKLKVGDKKEVSLSNCLSGKKRRWIKAKA